MSNDEKHDFTPIDADDLAERLGEGDGLPGIIAVLGELKSGSIITEEGVATLFRRHPVSVKRAVQRGELPHPTRLFGQNAWTVGALIRHIEGRLERAAKEAERTARRVANLSP
jgi:hypothetical protein